MVTTDVSVARRDALRWIAAREPVETFPRFPSLAMVRGMMVDGLVEALPLCRKTDPYRFRLTPAGRKAKRLVLPIVFSSPMIRAALDGRKTMTRRIMEPSAGHGSRWDRLEPDDLLWVREAFFDTLDTTVSYMADGGPRPPTGWTSGRYMPRELSRITLRVTAKPRAESLHSITDEDARAEGFADRLSFAALWRELHKPEGWSSNPTVAVISFAAILRNVEHVEC